MSKNLKIGQFRKSGLQNSQYLTVYETPKDYELEYIKNELHPGAQDLAITFKTGQTNDKIYHVKGRIKKIANFFQKITVYIQEKNSITGDIQNIKYIDINPGDETEDVPFEIVFQSLSNFNQIVFDLERGGKFAEKKVAAEIDEISVLTNILPLIGQKEPIVKLGIQGRPGMLMAINGEEIHIGKTGIYEIYYEDIQVTSVAFDIREQEKISNKDPDYFIMDYQYE